MKSLFKRSLSVFLAIIMLCSVMTVAGVSASAAFKGVNVTIKSAQGAFEDITKSYQQGETFELAVNWQSDELMVNGLIDTYLDYEGLRVTKQDVNKKARSGGASNISDKCQRENGLVTLNFSNFEYPTDWKVQDYVVKYQVKVLAEVGTNQTMIVDFPDANAVKKVTGEDGTEQEVTISYIANKEIVEENKDGFDLNVTLSDPQPAVKRYTIVGHINGKDVGFEGDANTVVPEYNFVDGKVTIPFTRESHVFVKTVNTEPTEWYMFNTYCEDTSGVLYKTDTGSTQKMKVPAGYVTFTLTENEDGSLGLSYEADTTNIPTEPYIPKEYTIVGHINGEDVGFDGDAQSIVPDYNFVDGKVTIVFNEESYVFVKTTDNVNWFMSEGHCTETSGVMYDTTTTQLTDANKMYVPAGKITFTLVENEDGTITLSYESDPDYVPVITPKQYTVVGKINGAMVGCEDDYKTVVEEYNFVNGSVTIEFTEDSYIFVKTTDNKHWYMFSKYIDTTTGTMYNTATGTAEKMLIPAGKMTLILNERANGALRLSYEPYVEPEPTTESTEATVTEPAPTTPTTEPTPTNPTTEPKETVKTAAPGGSITAVDKFIKGVKSDADLKGSVYQKLQLKSKKTSSKSISVKWNKVKGAKKYIVYGAKCGNNKYKKLKTVSTKTTSYTQKKLKKDTYYRYTVVAVNSKNKVITTSKTVHIATKYKKVCNPKAVKVASSKVTLKLKRKFNLKAKAVSESKKLKVKKHSGIKYVSTNTKIATVSSKGIIKAKKKGTCYVYAYAQNGVGKKVKVIVKK